MECRNIEELLSPYLDKNLSREEMVRVEGHLRICPRCPGELERLKRTIHLVSSLEEVEPPENFLSGIHRKLKVESKLRRFLDKVFLPLPVKLPLGALATVLIAVLIISLNRYYLPGQAPREMTRRLPENLELEREEESREVTAKPKPSLSAVRKEMEEMEDAAVTFARYGRRAISVSYQVQVATENLPVSLLKARRAIYLNEGKIISPSDEDMVAQIASREIRYSRILFKIPPRNYSQVLTQLKEAGKITSVIPPKEAEKYELKLREEEIKPALIHIRLELTQIEKE